MASSAHQDVFRFTSLRAPKTPKPEQWYLRYAKDNFLNYLEIILFTDRDLTDGTFSVIGGKIFKDVFCNQSKTNDTIVTEVLELTNFGTMQKVECTIIDASGYADIKALPNSKSYSFSEKGKDGNIYTWFLEHSIHFTEKLDLASRIIQSHIINFDKQVLICQLQQALGESNLSEFVLTVEHVNGIITNRTSNTPQFKDIKGQLFDRLYELYIAKRRFPVNLDHIIRQIQTLHVIEFLGYDDFSHDQELVNRKGCNSFAAKLRGLFQSTKQTSIPKQQINSLLTGQTTPCDISGFTAIGPFVLEPYINSKEDLKVFFNVQPLVHPIFSRLRNFHIPFNKIRPIGIADLKIVKQILVRYEPGEVAHIENVLKGESKERIHRRSDTIETFISDETTREAETTRESQTTDRNEMQRETQRTITEALNFNTDASVHYDGGTIDATVNAGFSWDKSTEESNRNAANFAKEVMQKSAERIMQRTQSLRNTRRTSEMEETNKHGIDNSKGNDHVIGIYRYVNKRYKAQVFNYGERMMFEFLIPEPSEFYKKAMENKSNFKPATSFTCTKNKKPTLTSMGITDKNLLTEQIVKDYEKILNTTFDAYPISVSKTQNSVLYAGKLDTERKDGNTTDESAVIKANTSILSLTPSIEATMKAASNLDYGLDMGPATSVVNDLVIGAKITIEAKIISNAHWDHQFDNKTKAWKNSKEKAFVFITCSALQDEISIAVTEDNKVMIVNLNQIDNQGFPSNIARRNIVINNNQSPSITFTSKCNWCQFYFIEITIKQEADSSVIDSWKQKVFNQINTKVDEVNNETEGFCKEAEKKFIADQKANEEVSLIKIKGKNPEINKVIINEELHKHAITLFAKEFDKDTDGDLLADKPIAYQSELIEKFKGASCVKIKVKNDAGIEIETDVCNINPVDKECKIFPVLDIDIARKKGEVVQFLEQAFEWEKISYLLYPYFYGDKSRWMETYDHFDNEQNDTSFVAFLRAGYARVLVPVRDAYRDAVLQFLYSRKPWSGGSAPVISDDMYLPIYEELRNQTDEYHDAVPEGEPWEFVLPTSLIYLQQDSILPEYDGKFPIKK